MMKVLRDKDSGICRVGASPSATVASMVSVIPPPGSSMPACHWLTATPNPCCSVFKPFIFCSNVQIGSGTISPSYGADDPAKIKPRFQRQVDRAHPLYAAHSKIKPIPGTDVDQSTLDTLLRMETQCIDDMEIFLKEYTPKSDAELQELFKDVVDSEMKLYNMI